MRVCGIIAEYNPLHEGHLFHIRETRARLGRDAGLVAVLSGHAVQRGDFPILTKYARTRMALAAGIDLVIELPSPFACAPAERFARAAVGLLASMGMVTHLSFGAECDDLEALASASALHPGRCPKNRTLAAALPALYPEKAHLYTPNNILAMEYLRAIRDLAPGMIPVAVGRRGSAHDDDGLSAGAIRRRIWEGREPEIPFIGVWREEKEAGRAPVSIFSRSEILLSCLRRLRAEDWARVPDTGGGLDRRLLGAVLRTGTLEELLAAAKTKRYTMARLRRCVLCAFLGITAEHVRRPPPLRLLGIGRRGGELLSRLTGPVISRPAAHREALALEASVTDQMTLFMPSPQPAGMEWRQGVIKMEPAL